MPPSVQSNKVWELALFVHIIPRHRQRKKRPLQNRSAHEKDRTMNNAAEQDLPAFDGFWNFEDPAGSEAKFRELLPKAEESGDRGYLAELLTQIARTQGLQQEFSDALTTLDRADALIGPEMKTARVRSLLERGRVFNSSGKPETSLSFFNDALRLAQDAGLEFYAVDAAHMLGIAAKDSESLKWNAEA